MTWKMHTPTSTSTLTGDITVDFIRSLGKPPPATTNTPIQVLANPGLSSASSSASLTSSNDYATTSTSTTLSSTSTSTTLQKKMSSTLSNPLRVKSMSIGTHTSTAWTSTFDMLAGSTLKHDAPVPSGIPPGSASPSVETYNKYPTNTSSTADEDFDLWSSGPVVPKTSSQTSLSPSSSSGLLAGPGNRSFQYPSADPSTSTVKVTVDATSPPPSFSPPPTSTEAWKAHLPEPTQMSMSTSRTLGGLNHAKTSLDYLPLPLGLTGLRFLRVACSMFGAIAIAEDGTLHYWTLDSDLNEYTEGGPVPKLEGRTIVDIAAGHDHFLAVTVEGELYAWGSNQFYQCGQPGLARIHTPTKVTNQISACSAGGHSSLAIDNDGHVLTWGRAQTCITVPIDPSTASTPIGNSSDAPGKRPLTKPTHRTIAVDCLAHGEAQVASRQDPLRVGVPTAISEPLQCIHASLSSTMTILVTRKGEVFAVGDANAICSDDPYAYSLIPVQVPFPEGVRIVRALAGELHALALDTSGHLWSWGNRFSGGHPISDDSTSTPAALNAPYQLSKVGDVVIDFGISSTESAAINSKDELWVWGKNAFPKQFSLVGGEIPAGVSHGTSSSMLSVVFGAPRHDRTTPAPFAHSQSSALLFDSAADVADEPDEE